MIECFFCKANAEVEGKGVYPVTMITAVPYYRAQLPTGKWDSVPICLPCLKIKQPRFAQIDPSTAAKDTLEAGK